MRCMFCNKEALSDHLTCGEVTCPESTARSIQNFKVMQDTFLKHFPKKETEERD